MKMNRIEKLCRGKIQPKEEDFKWIFYYMLDREVELNRYAWSKIIRCLDQAKEVIKNEI